MAMKFMKIQCILSGCLFLFTLPLAFAQQSSPGNVPPRRPVITSEPLTKFDLDFRGGTPKELAAAIQEASGRPLNVIVPEEFADTKLPALKMKNVDVSQLFRALSESSGKEEARYTPGGMNTLVTVHKFDFRAQDTLSDDTIWHFHSEPSSAAAQATLKVCRFYPLANYLEAGTTIDDITTAIKTGASMLGQATGIHGETGPTISFHKDTKLLIAVGEPSKLEIIDSVLAALD